jgi:NAD(P)-dependent dehydrogenase (short-subunit alcohol dehydrogenase family)
MTTIKDLINLNGRRALITGATGGLGRVMASTLAELGADLILVDISSSDIESLSKNLTNNWGIKVESYFCDLEQQDQRSDLIEFIKASGRELNILVNNAAFVGSSGLQGWSVPFEDQSIETWRRALEVNLTSIFDICQNLTPLMRNSEGATIINIASTYGLYGPDWSLYKNTDMSNPAAYSASKGGVIQLTRWLSTTVAPDIRVNSISPGGIFRNQPEVFVKRYEDRTPLGRMATEDDFCGIVAYLSSDMSNYMTGQNLSIDGGWGVW